MPLRFVDRILVHLAHGNYRPSTADDIATAMRVDEERRPLFDEAIERLVAEERLIAGKSGKLSLPPMPEEIVGRYKKHPKGFGFVRPEAPYQEGDLFIPQGRSRDAVTGDVVRVAVRRQPWRAKGKSDRSGLVGAIQEVIERGHQQYVGVLVRRKGGWMVDPDGRSLFDPVLVRDPHAKNAKEGDKVVVELVHYPDEEYLAEGVITRVLGEAGRPDVETQAVIAAHGLREEFPEEVVAEASEAVRRFDEDVARLAEDRLDLRERYVITIDPPDARDFDDAISIEHDERTGTWTLGVHIADVAHFVRPGGAIDLEARERGNSVYLPRHVIPMLPETLSNGVCSLQEGVDRLTKSAFIDFDAKGHPQGQRLAATIIRSAKRLTYLEAQALIDGDEKAARKHARTEPRYDEQLVTTLRAADRLAKLLRARRLEEGMIVLDLPEVELVFDEAGNVVDAVPEDDAFTHTLIEQFMVAANEALARVFDAIDVPILRRIHPDPAYGNMAELEAFARSLGLRIPAEPNRHDLREILESTRGTPAGRAIHFAVLRTFSRASYSPAMIGHFALASEHYAHFTSPIRRYPDLTLHHALEAFLEMTENGERVPGGRGRRRLAESMLSDERVPNEADLVTVGRMCSDTEQNADDAERALRSYLVLKFLSEHHLGDEFEAVVTGLASRGVFVQLSRFLQDGMIAMEDLPSSDDRDDRWISDADTGRLVARRSGASIGLGDAIGVRIEEIDLAGRQMRLTVTRLAERTAIRRPAAAGDRGRGGRGGSGRDGDRHGKGKSKGGGPKGSRGGKVGAKGKGKGKGKSPGKGKSKGKGGAR